jgi:hypothetical protein
MVKPIPQYGKTIRLTKETLEGLLPWDSDPNHAFLKMKAEIETNHALAILPIQERTSAPQPTHNYSPCKFDEGALIKTIQEAIISSLEKIRDESH